MAHPPNARYGSGTGVGLSAQPSASIPKPKPKPKVAGSDPLDKPRRQWKDPFDKKRASDSDPNEPFDIDLLAAAFATHSQPSPNLLEIREYARELGLGEPGAYSGFQWRIETSPLKDLHSLPSKYRHSGDFEWIGPQKNGWPQYLWDSGEFKTVEATVDRLREGYVAVSWTWGRYQLRDSRGRPLWRHSTGVDWRVPRMEDVADFEHNYRIERLSHLKWLLRKIPNVRYFWVDVLCINQNEGKEDEKNQEILKQAHIFQNAKAVISYLWTLQEAQSQNRHLSRALAAFGGLVSWCLHFTSSRHVFDRRAGGHHEPVAPQHEWDDIFKRIRDDNWFTSLWALQEIVLAPAALWVTHDGYFCSINGKPLTTRLFATAIRLISSLCERRDRHWDRAERRFCEITETSPQMFAALKKSLDNAERERKAAVGDEISSLGGSQGYSKPVVETSEMPRTPWPIRCRRGEKHLKDHVKGWVEWSLGKSGIDVSLKATRPAILVAATNREVVDNQSKELALLAALKIGFHPGFVLADQDQAKYRQMSCNLLNVILQVEGLSIFDVSHTTFVQPFRHQPDSTFNVAEWDMPESSIPYFHLQERSDLSQLESDYEDGRLDRSTWTDISERSDRVERMADYVLNGVQHWVPILGSGAFSLTNMSPTSAFKPNTRSRHFVMETSQGWHMHSHGSLHIPSTARYQDITKKSNDTRLFFTPNGGSVEYPIERLNHRRNVYKTQRWLTDSLGKAQFIFLPLCVRREREHTVKIGSSKSSEAYLLLPEKIEDEVTGIVLVGKESAQDSHPPRYYKFGTYRGSGVFKPLKHLVGDEGILVTSLPEESLLPPFSKTDCQAVEKMAENIHKELSDTNDEEEGFETIRYIEIFDMFERSRTPGQTPGKDRKAFLGD